MAIRGLFSNACLSEPFSPQERTNAMYEALINALKSHQGHQPILNELDDLATAYPKGPPQLFSPFPSISSQILFSTGAV